MADLQIERLNILDTEYAEIIANSTNPDFELELVKLQVEKTEARLKTQFMTLLNRKPETVEQWEELMDAWEKACGYRPNELHLAAIEQLWKNQSL